MYGVGQLVDFFGDEFNGVINCLDVFCSIIWNFDVEFFFECYYQFNIVQGVSVQIIDEVCIVGYFFSIDIKMFNNDFFYVFENVRYFRFLQ